MHFWFSTLGIDHLPVGHLLRATPRQPVFDNGTYREAIDAARPQRSPLFTDIDGTRITWVDGRHEQVDTILLATGYRPDLGYLAQLGALDDTGAPRHDRGLSRTHPGLGYVGLDWQRSPASASLRGVGRDADYVINRLLHRARDRNRCCAAIRA